MVVAKGNSLQPPSAAPLQSVIVVIITNIRRSARKLLLGICCYVVKRLPVICCYVVKGLPVIRNKHALFDMILVLFTKLLSVCFMTFLS